MRAARFLYTLSQQPKKLHSIFSREAQSKLQNISVTSSVGFALARTRPLYRAMCCIANAMLARNGRSQNQQQANGDQQFFIRVLLKEEEQHEQQQQIAGVQVVQM